MPRVTRPPGQQKDLSANAGAGVENHILPTSGSGWKKTLVKFVEARHHKRAENGDVRPAPRPLHAGRRPCYAAGAKQQPTQNRISHHVAALPHVVVPKFKSLQVHVEQVVEYRIENPAGVVGRAQVGRFNGDDDDPKGRRKPSFNELVPSRFQASGPPAIVEVQRATNNASGKARVLILVACRNSVLLNRIVGSLARNHDVVNMALAQSRAANAHEACLLQKFRDRTTAAVAHA
jgi:hypothetical protein